MNSKFTEAQTQKDQTCSLLLDPYENVNQRFGPEEVPDVLWDRFTDLRNYIEYP
ncbi:MAG: hypothetical protein ABEJ65_06635 [bacterium]